MVQQFDAQRLAASAQFAATIARCLQSHGKDILENRTRMQGLLRDYHPADEKDIRLLMNGFDDGIAQRFAGFSSAPDAGIIDRETSRLVAEAGLQPELARWIVSTWSAGIHGMPKAATIPAAGSASSPADSLTWDDAIPIAPGIQTRSVATPGTVQNVLQTPMARYVAIGAIGILCIAGLKYLIEMPSPETKTTTPERPVAAGPKSSDPPTSNVLVASTSDDANSWPVFPAGKRPGQAPNDFQFQFNLQLPDKRIVAYNVYVAFDRTLSRGSSAVRALDLRSDDANMISSTDAIPATRELEASSKVYFVRVLTSAWAKNPSDVPRVCIALSSGPTRQRFEPEQGVFCALELRGKDCGPVLGCGRLG